jgi:hypothetical protein
MKLKRHILLLICLASTPLRAAAYSGCLDYGAPIKTPEVLSIPHMYTFGKTNRFRFSVGYAEVNDTPQWNQEAIPPLNRARASEAARTALGAYVPTPAKWEVIRTELIPFHNSDWWFYLVRFKLTIRQHNDAHHSFEYFAIPVLMDGTVIKGRKIWPTTESTPTRLSAPYAAHFESDSKRWPREMSKTLRMWIIMPFVLVGILCGIRAWWCKLYRLLVGRERLDSDPQIMRARVVFDALRIFPPSKWPESDKKKWESRCWIYGIAAILLLGGIATLDVMNII